MNTTAIDRQVNIHNRYCDALLSKHLPCSCHQVMAAEQLAAMKERIKDYEKRIAQLVKVNAEHPYHEACPKCLNTKRLLQKRVEKQEKRIHDLEEQLEVCKGGKMAIDLRDKRIQELEHPWRPIESAPIGKEIILSNFKKKLRKVWNAKLSHSSIEIYCDGWIATHWMPLPTPPEGETE